MLIPLNPTPAPPPPIFFKFIFQINMDFSLDRELNLHIKKNHEYLGLKVF